MKVILSRKGMDSKAGGIPSPILPDGTLLSLPIPDTNGFTGKYDDYLFNAHHSGEKSLRDIISELSPRFNFDKKTFCHLDPDIYENVICKHGNRKPAFGQCDASAGHLDNMGVGVGDVFLFYGMFRQTEYTSEGKLQYVKDKPIIHSIYGYMKIGEIIESQPEMDHDYPLHPHSMQAKYKSNRLYIPSDSGTFSYDEKLVLTMPNQDKRRVWRLPAFFAGDKIHISWQGENRPALSDQYAILNSSCRGQEFVITPKSEATEQQLSEWVNSLLHTVESRFEGLEKQMIIHFVIPDAHGKIYCRKEHAIRNVDYNKCRPCPLAAGSIQGEGVECYYEDMVKNYSALPFAANHYDELARISMLIEKGLIGKEPERKD